MLKTAVGFDADRVISAIVDRHDSGDQLYDRVKLDKNNNNHFLYFLFYFNTKLFNNNIYFFIFKHFFSFFIK